MASSPASRALATSGAAIPPLAPPSSILLDVYIVHTGELFQRFKVKDSDTVQELIQFISERLRVPLYSSPSAKVTSLMLYTQHGREMRRGKILKYLVPSDAASASLMQNAASPSTSPATSPALGGFAVAPAQHPKAGFALPSSAAPAASTALASASHAASSSHVQTTHSSSSSSSSPFSSQLSPSSSGTGSSLYTPTTEAFLYFRANPPQPRVVEPGDFPLHLPAQGSVASSSNVGAHPLMRFSGALTRTLPIFEATFAEHVEQAQAHIEVTDERRRACIAILEANRVRVRGMQAAQRLALSHISRALQRTSGFQKHYAVHAARFHDVLNGFERDLEALMSTEIPKALLSSGDDASAGRGFVPRHVETLLDCHDEGKLRELRSVCDRDLATLEDKVASLEKLAQDVRNGPAKPGLYERQQEQLQHMQRTLVEFDSIRAKQQTLLAALISDRSRVESQIADLVRIMSEQARRRAAPAGADAPEEPVELEASQTITPEELTRGFRIIDENHDRVIMPQLQALEQSANDLIASLGEAQREIDPLFEEDFAFVTQQLKKCRKLEQKTPVYLGAVQDEARQFEQLERLKHMPTALNAFLSELVRRTLYRDTFLERIKSFAERLEAFRLQEQEARRRFVVDHLPFLPPDPKWRKLAKAQPTRCQIELEDHDRYMPELRPHDVPGLVLAHSSEADLLEKEQHAQALAHSGCLVLDVPEFPQSPRDNARQDSSRAADDGGQGAADDDDDDDDDDLGGGGDVTGSMIEYEAQLAEMRERIDQLQHEHASELAALHDKLAKSEARAIEATDNAAHLEVQLNDLSEDNDAKTQRVDQLEEELTSMSMKVSHYLDKTEAWKEIGRTRIAFTNFTAHDLVLMVLNDDGFYSCFNRGAPYRFMSEDSRQAIVTDVANPPRIILGEIIEIEAKRTARRNPDPDGDVYQFNPYRIPFGEHYYVVTIVEISE